MKKYNVKQSDRFILEYTNIIHYINYVLKNISASNKLKNKVFESIENLEIIPEAFPLVKHELDVDVQLRYCKCNNYCIFYYIDKDDVVLYSFLYAKSDIHNRLKDKSDE